MTPNTATALPPPALQRRLRALGATARLARTPNGPAIEVLDEEDRLLFRYEPASGRTILSVPRGDLELSAPHGEIALRSGKGISLGGPELALSADRARLRFGETLFTGDRIDGHLKEARFTLEKLVLSAGRILERARSVHRRIEGVCETRAGRMRTLVEGLLYLRGGEEAVLKSRGTARIDGARVELG